ncbi:hypothetical protein N7501_005892 [Penicillium viridicatum]|nr:hypothetical protein N7501_005892 [Penicillium viridicatum]
MVGTWAAPALAEWTPPPPPPPVLAYIYQHFRGRGAGRNIPSDPPNVEMGLPSQLTELRQQLAGVSESMGERDRQYEERLNTLQETLRLLSEDVIFLLNAAHASSSQTKGRKIESVGSPAEGPRT